MSVENKKASRDRKSPAGGWPEAYQDVWDSLLYRSYCTLDEERVMRETQADTAASSVPAGEPAVRNVHTQTE